MIKITRNEACTILKTKRPGVKKFYVNMSRGKEKLYIGFKLIQDNWKADEFTNLALYKKWVEE